jgi:hypothetical protein
MMNQPDKTLLDFVEGRLSAEEFEQILYRNSDLEIYLKDEPRLPVSYYIKGDVYTYLIQLDFKDAADLLNAFGAVRDFLERKQIAFKPTGLYEDLYSIILSAQPKWLDVETGYVSRTLLPEAGSQSGAELRDWLKKRFLEKFRYATVPPEWLQNPEWLYSQGEPLIFLGQISVEHFFHDEAAVYVFYNPKTGACETIVQIC